MIRIDIEKVHQRILNIAEAFDKICAEHDIPYYMLGGTMLDKDYANEQTMHIITHIEDYQDMVYKNWRTALTMGDLTLRMRDVMRFLKESNYIV